MTVTHWAASVYDLPLAVAYTWAGGTQRSRRGLLLALFDDEGRAGYGEMAPPPHRTPADRELWASARATLDRLRLAQPLDLLAQVETAHPEARLRAAFACALLDLASQAGGHPLAEHLALGLEDGRAPHAQVEVNGLVPAVPPRQAVEQALELTAQGYRTLKLKSDADVKACARRVAAVREAIGPDVRLRLDPNHAWPADHVLDHLRTLARFDLEYVEDPVVFHDVRTSRRLRQEAPVPVALDHPVTSPEAAGRLAREDAADAIILKPQRLGGPDHAARAIAAVEAEGARAVVTNSLETTIGRAMAVHTAALLGDPTTACGLGTARFLARDVGPDAFAPIDGTVTLKARPGLGVQAGDGPAWQRHRLGDP